MYHYFISDKKNQARREHIVEECKKIGLDPIFFDAIMGKELSAEELKKYTLESNFLTLGEIGCALSHLGVLQEFLKSSEEAVFVFEDDIIFSSQVSNTLLNGLMDFIKKEDKPAVVTLYAGEIYYKEVSSVQNVKIYSTPRFMGSYGYCINRLGAEEIIRLQERLYFEFDQYRYYYYLTKLRLYMIGENLVDVNKEMIISDLEEDRNKSTQEMDRSTLQSSHFNVAFNKLSVLNKIRSIYRRGKKHVLAKKFEV